MTSILVIEKHAMTAPSAHDDRGRQLARQIRDDENYSPGGTIPYIAQSPKETDFARRTAKVSAKCQLFKCVPNALVKTPSCSRRIANTSTLRRWPPRPGPDLEHQPPPQEPAATEHISRLLPGRASRFRVSGMLGQTHDRRQSAGGLGRINETTKSSKRRFSRGSFFLNRMCATLASSTRAGAIIGVCKLPAYLWPRALALRQAVLQSSTALYLQITEDCLDL